MLTKLRFFTAIETRPIKRVGARALVVLLLLLSLGCTTAPGQPTEAVHVRLPFIPVTFSLDSQGHFSVSTGLSITTPVGTFSVSAEVTTPIARNSTRVSIVHSVNGIPVKDVYDIAERNPMNICLNGNFWESIANGNITIQTLDDTSIISIIKAGSECDTADSSAAASPEISTPVSPQCHGLSGFGP